MARGIVEGMDKKTVIESVNPLDPNWVFARCSNPMCRGKQSGGLEGQGFLTQVLREDAEREGFRAECNECFCR